MAVFCKVTAQIAPELVSVLPGGDDQAKLHCLLTLYSEDNPGAYQPLDFEWFQGCLLATGSLLAITALEKTVKNATKENTDGARIKVESCEESDSPLMRVVSEDNTVDSEENMIPVEASVIKSDPDGHQVVADGSHSFCGDCGDDLEKEDSDDGNISAEHGDEEEMNDVEACTPNLDKRVGRRGKKHTVGRTRRKKERRSPSNTDNSTRGAASVKDEPQKAPLLVRVSKKNIKSSGLSYSGRHQYRKIIDSDFSLKDGIYHCKRCSYTTTKPKLLKEHVHNRHDPEAFHCDQCDKGFRRKSFYNAHMRTFHKPQGLRNCQLCGVSFENEEEIKEHWKKDHKLMINAKDDHENETESDEKGYSLTPLRWKNLYKKKYNYFYCCFCDFSNQKERYMRQHLTRKHQTNNFSCCVCNEEFSTFDLYTDHVKTHTTDECEGEVHACTICGKVYGTEKTFILHMSEYHADTNFILDGNNAETQLVDKYHLVVRNEIIGEGNTSQPDQPMTPSADGGISTTNSDQQSPPNQSVPPENIDGAFVTQSVPTTGEESSKVQDSVKSSDGPPLVGYHGYLQCFCCSFVGKNRRSLNEHIQRRHGAKKFKCVFCPKKFSRKSGLNMHAATHTGKEYICVYCGDMLGTFAAYDKHMHIHWDAEGASKHAIDKALYTIPVSKGIMWESMFESNGNDFNCNYCPFTTLLKRFMRQHIVNEHKLCPFSCAVCKTEFPSLTAVASHMIEHAEEDIFKEEEKSETGTDEKNPSVSVCSICGKAYGLKATMVQHMRKCHPGIKKLKGDPSVDEKSQDSTDSQSGGGTTTDYVACYKCSFVGTRKNLNEHIQRRHADKRYACPKCPKRYSTRSQLNEHVKTHTTSSICEICGKILSGKGALKTHIKIMHEGLKRNLTREYQCPDCGVLRQGKASFEAHMNEHKSITPYECDVCGKKFIGKPHLAAHRRLHLQIEHRCSVCDKNYTSRSHLTRHEKTHWRQQVDL